MTISIWYKRQDSNPEVVDHANSISQAEYMSAEYTLAFGCVFGQHRYNKDKVWYGRRNAEPSDLSANYGLNSRTIV